MLSDFHLLLGQIHPQQMRYNGWGAPNGCFLMDEINHDGWIWSPWRKLKLRSRVKKCINYCWSDIVVGEQVMRNENIFLYIIDDVMMAKFWSSTAWVIIKEVHGFGFIFCRLNVCQKSIEGQKQPKKRSAFQL